MRFTELHISGFGIWSGLELHALSPQLTVIYGPNEAGKTTILECLRGVLYGFSPARRDRYLPPLHGGAAGGAVGLRVDGQDYTVARHDDRSRLLGGVTVTGPDGSTQGDSHLAELLGGLDEPAYTNIFSVGLRELQELATLNDGEAATWLYDLSSGLDGVSISEALRELRTSRSRLVSETGDKSQVIDLLAQRDALQAEIDDLSSLHDRYWRLSTQRAAADEAIRATEESLSALSGVMQKVEAALSAGEPWRERMLVEEKIAAFERLGDFPADALRRLEAVLVALRKAKRRRAQIKLRRQQLRAQRSQIKVNERFWRQGPRIAALTEHEPWIATLEEQLRAAEQNVAEHERQVVAARAKCGLPADFSPASATLRAGAAAELRDPASQLRAARGRFKEARSQSQSLREARVTRREEIASALASRGESSLPAALEKQGQLVAQYRRRLQLDDRLDQMAMHREELEDKHRKLLDREVLALWQLIAIAVVFVFGGGLVLAGLIIPWGTGTAILGALIAIGAGVSKFALERSAAHRLQATERQLKMLKGQFEQVKAERAELDELLPSGGGALTSRLQTAEAELASLEELLSIDARLQAADSEATAAKAHLKRAAEEWHRAQRRWQQALVEAGLPADLSPANVKQMLKHAGLLRPLERRLQHAREDLDRCRREHGAVAARVEQLAADAGWQRDRAAPAVPLVEQLRRLRRELATEEEQVQRRGQLDELLERFQRLRLKYNRRVRTLSRRRRELYQAASAMDENDFRRRAQQRAELDELLRRRSALTQQIQATLPGGANEHELSALLGLPAGELDMRREELAGQWQSAADEIKRLSEQRGAIAHEQLLLADDRRLAHKQLELDVVDQRLAEAAERWRTLALTEYLIQTVKDDYERNRQPEVLQEASRYLQRLTEGRYSRVWTPLGEQALRVDDDQRRPLAIELLSTGAREQLFLSLRLALVTRYAHSGKAMPLVLDDVLVNFDKQRAAAAAGVFAEFAAAGHQLLMFTCHEHIADLFRTLRCDVRSLPASADTSRKIVGPQANEPEAAIEAPRRRRERRSKEPQQQAAPPASQEVSPPVASPADDAPSEPMASDVASSAPEPARRLEPVRHHRLDAPHEVRPTNSSRRRRWSAEEFEGELQDQVNVAFDGDWRDGG